MQPLSSAALLDVWEQGQNHSLPYRALLLLMAASPGTAPEHLARLSLGRRDASLLTLREWMFGPRLPAVASCPACREPLEMEFDVADLRVAPDLELVDPAQARDTGERAGEHSVRVGERTFWFRLPDSLDLLAIQESIHGGADLERARRVLLQRCLMRVEGDGSHPIDMLDEATLATVEAAMAEADPQADLQIELTCPVCTHRWELSFDVVAYLWAEIDNRAARLLRDVHLLASAYGWHESDILALSAQRRQVYLNLVNS